MQPQLRRVVAGANSNQVARVQRRNKGGRALIVIKVWRRMSAHGANKDACRTAKPVLASVGNPSSDFLCRAISLAQLSKVPSTRLRSACVVFDPLGGEGTCYSLPGLAMDIAETLDVLA